MRSRMCPGMISVLSAIVHKQHGLKQGRMKRTSFLIIEGGPGLCTGGRGGKEPMQPKAAFVASVLEANTLKPDSTEISHVHCCMSSSSSSLLAL